MDEGAIAGAKKQTRHFCLASWTSPSDWTRVSGSSVALCPSVECSFTRWASSSGSSLTTSMRGLRPIESRPLGGPDLTGTLRAAARGQNMKSPKARTCVAGAQFAGGPSLSGPAASESIDGSARPDGRSSARIAEPTLNDRLWGAMALCGTSPRRFDPGATTGGHVVVQDGRVHGSSGRHGAGSA